MNSKIIFFLSILSMTFGLSLSASARSEFSKVCVNPKTLMCNTPEVVKLKKKLRKRIAAAKADQKKFIQMSWDQRQMMSRIYHGTKKNMLNYVRNKYFLSSLNAEFFPKFEDKFSRNYHFTSTSPQLNDPEVLKKLGLNPKNTDLNATNISSIAGNKPFYGIAFANLPIYLTKKTQYLYKFVTAHEMGHYLGPWSYFKDFDLKNQKLKASGFDSEKYPFMEELEEIRSQNSIGFTKSCIRKIEDRHRVLLSKAESKGEVFGSCLETENKKCLAVYRAKGAPQAIANKICSSPKLFQHCMIANRINPNLMKFYVDLLQVKKDPFARPKPPMFDYDDCGNFQGEETFADYLAHKVNLKEFKSAKEIRRYAFEASAFFCMAHEDLQLRVQKNLQAKKAQSKQKVPSSFQTTRLCGHDHSSDSNSNSELSQISDFLSEHLSEKTEDGTSEMSRLNAASGGHSMKTTSHHPPLLDRLNFLFKFKRVRSAFHCSIKNKEFL